MYLNFPNLGSQRALLSHVFTSYPDPQLAPNYIQQSMTFSNASHKQQNNQQYLDWVRYVFRLRTS